MFTEKIQEEICHGKGIPVLQCIYFNTSYKEFYLFFTNNSTENI
jgi:hypothetical protein